MSVGYWIVAQEFACVYYTNCTIIIFHSRSSVSANGSFARVISLVLVVRIGLKSDTNSGSPSIIDTRLASGSLELKYLHRK